MPIIVGRAVHVHPLVTILAVLCGGFGLVALATLGDVKGLAILILGGYACWKRGRTTLANAPRDYAPDHLPEELLS